MKYLITMLISYLIGSFNVAYFISRAKGFDIRERGSNNPGACNMKVNFGWAAGVFTGLCDMAKAIIAIRLCGLLFPGNEVIPYLAGAMAVVGHIYPFYMGFRGGKGYASYIGMMVALNFPLSLAVMAVTVVVTVVSNYIAIGTYAALLVAVTYYLFRGTNVCTTAIVTAVSLLTAWKHSINIKRILNHKEIGFREK